MNKEMVKVGIIGTGDIGTVHAQNLARRTIGAQVVAVMDIDLQRAESAAADCGDARTYTDAAELVADPNVDAVLIASPDFAHADQAIACIEAGKPVLCEKPLATTLADAERVVRAEVAAGRRLLQVGFMRVYDRAHVDLKAVIERGDIGAALRFRGTHINPDRGQVTIEWAIVNSFIHDIHTARWIMGQEVSSAYTQWVTADSSDPQSARWGIIQLAFDNGALGTLEWSGASGYGYEITVEVIGETGTVSTADHSSPFLRQGEVRAQAITPDWPQRFARAYVDEVQIWVNAISKGEPTGPSAWDGYMSLVVADACVRSTLTGLPEATGGMERPSLY